MLPLWGEKSENGHLMCCIMPIILFIKVNAQCDELTMVVVWTTLTTHQRCDTQHAIAKLFEFQSLGKSSGVSTYILKIPKFPSNTKYNKLRVASMSKKWAQSFQPYIHMSIFSQLSTPILTNLHTMLPLWDICLRKDLINQNTNTSICPGSNLPVITSLKQKHWQQFPQIYLN